jgi:hypothetical protein
MKMVINVVKSIINLFKRIFGKFIEHILNHKVVFFTNRLLISQPSV